MKLWILLVLFAAGVARSEQVTISILATTDLHGNLYPVDYSTGRPAPRGLARIATLVRAARTENPNSILIDCGDTIQGTPLEYIYQTTVRAGTVTAAAPEGVGEKKYDETAASMIALLRYRSGVPWYRLQGLEKSLGIPLPMATQCEIVTETAVMLQPALQELTRQAAQGEVVHNDDTSMRVLSLDREPDIAPDRTGVFTSGVVWIFQAGRIALFFTGCQHAGENLAEVLKQRPTELPPPIQMCDALSRNVPKAAGAFATLLANCLAHYLDSGIIRSE